MTVYDGHYGSYAVIYVFGLSRYMEVYDRDMTVYAEKEHFIQVIYANVLGTRPVLLLIDAVVSVYDLL